MLAQRWALCLTGRHCGKDRALARIVARMEHASLAVPSGGREPTGNG